MSSTNYNLNIDTGEQKKTSTWPALRKLVDLLPDQKGRLAISCIGHHDHLCRAEHGSARSSLAGPSINTSRIRTQDYAGILCNCGWLLLIYSLNLVSAVYLRTTLMGGFGQRLLFSLRNAIFNKLQELPVAFFAQNKAGDLISRVNNDTDKINQFFSQSLMQFISSLFIIAGAGVFLVILNWRPRSRHHGSFAADVDFCKICVPVGKEEKCGQPEKYGGVERRDPGKPRQFQSGTGF